MLTRGVPISKPCPNADARQHELQLRRISPCRNRRRLFCIHNQVQHHAEGFVRFVLPARLSSYGLATNKISLSKFVPQPSSLGKLHQCLGRLLLLCQTRWLHLDVPRILAADNHQRIHPNTNYRPALRRRPFRRLRLERAPDRDCQWHSIRLL